MPNILNTIKPKEQINGFKLQPEIYLYETKLVKIYSPILALGNNKYYFWAYSFNDKDVIMVKANKLKLATKQAKVLF